MKGKKRLEVEERIIREGKFIVDHQTTIRGTAKYMSVSKSTVHKDLKKILPELDPELSAQVQEVVKENEQQRHVRGGEATRAKYLKLRLSNA